MKPIPGARQDLNLLSPDLVTPYTHQYNLTLEWVLPAQTLVRVAYIGSRSFHLLTQGIYNRPVVVPGIPTMEATLNARRPDQRYDAINIVESNSIGYYDAAQASVEKRLTHGLTFRAAYTFSKNINQGGDFTETASGVEVPPETGNTTCETGNRVSDQKGPALFDTPQVFTISYSYRLPFFAGSDRMAGGRAPRVAGVGHNSFSVRGCFPLPYRIGCVRLRQRGRQRAGSSQHPEPIPPG